MTSIDPIIAVDMGGTQLRLALVDSSGAILDRIREPTQSEQGPDRVADRIIEAAEGLLKKNGFAKALGMGAAIASPQDNEGVLHFPPNLEGWQVVPFKSMLSHRFGGPVWIGNDANVAALGELVFGAGKGVSDLIYLTVSTGIGGGVVTGGELLTGSRGLGGELGHIFIARDGPPSLCGHVGCLESLASGPGIANRAREALAAGQESVLSTMADNGPSHVRAEHVFQAAIQGDAYASQLIADVGEDLARGIAGLIHVFNPKIFVVGGSVVLHNWHVLGPIVDKEVKRLLMPGFLDGFELRLSQFGDDVGLVGAAALVVREHARGVT